MKTIQTLILSASAIVFDFDGVIVQRSEFFKQAAWPKVFSDYPEEYRKHFEAAEREYGGGRGGDRFGIIRTTLAKLGLKDEVLEGEMHRRASAYDAIVQRAILEAGIPADDHKALTALSLKYPLYANSATPQEALRRTVKALGLQVFTDVLGRPNSKIENFHQIATSLKIASKRILFIGDSESDYKAALDFGCPFIGFNNDWNQWASSKQEFLTISSLAEIADAI